LIGGKLSLGLGVRGESEIYKEAEPEIAPVPYFNYENGPLEITGNNGIDATLRFYRNTHFSASLVGSLPMGEGYAPDDSDYLEGMDELHTLFGNQITNSPLVDKDYELEGVLGVINTF
jgi:outer membrane scaffolding protein for murein synthesis (MipA/OmpV family)